MQGMKESDEDIELEESEEPYMRREVHHVSPSKIADQFWCEMQLHLKLRLGIEPTEEMIKGSEIHRKLEEELGPVIDVEVSTFEDSIIAYILQMYTKLALLLNLGLTRELPVIGQLNEFDCIGIIDQVKVENNEDGKKELVITDFKTRKSRRAPGYEQKRRNRIQMQVYWHLLQNLINGNYTQEMFKQYFEMPEEIFASKELLDQLPEESKQILESYPPHELLNKVFTIFRELPELSSELLAIYLHQEDQSEVCVDRTFFHEDSFEVDMVWALSYWKGERIASDCPQNWMCNYCQFTDNCSFFLKRYLKTESKKKL